MTKRERFQRVLANEPVDRVPVAFFHHFTEMKDWNKGVTDRDAFERNVVGHAKALEKFNPDIIKVMNDTLMLMPMDVSFVKTADDLYKVQGIDLNGEYMARQVELTKRAIEIYKDKSDAPILVTPFSATQTLRNALSTEFFSVGNNEQLFKNLMEENPEAIADCLMRMSKGIAEMNKVLLTECGADGIYFSVSNQSGFFPRDFHQKYVAPSEKYVLEEAKKIRDMNVVHICGYHGRGNDLTLYTDYEAAAYSVAVNAEHTTLGRARKLFGNKPVIGGFKQDGIIYTGSHEEVKQAVFDILDEAGQVGVIIGADCTVPTDIDDDRFNWVRDAAKEYADTHQ